MEFSYRITEKDYVDAYNLRRRSRMQRILTIVFVCVVLGAWILLGTIFLSISPQLGEHFGSGLSQFRGISLEILIFAAIAVALKYIGLPALLRRSYRKNPLLQEEIFAKISSQSFDIQTSAGNSQLGWNGFESWKEGKNLILLFYHSPIYQIINVAGLSEAERVVLRGILTAVLPQKK